MNEIERERHIVELLSNALRLQGAERVRFLDQACVGDPEAREELEAMLQDETDLGNFLEVPAVAGMSAAPSERLLVVDDNETNLDILSRQLRRHGYEVLTADGGARALEIVAGQPVELVILDIMMPGIDGIEVLRRLRRDYSPTELPIIMATAKSHSQDIVQSAELGANDHVAKPLDFEVLVAKIRALLRLKAAAAASRSASREPSHGELQSGSVLAGRYRLEEQIGAGNFGTVYRARHLDLDLAIAIKVLEPHLSAGEPLQRFRQEGIAACRVRHPNAVRVSDFGVTEAGVAFLVMELLEGMTLDQELRARGRLSPCRVNEIVQPVCDVLAEAHAKNLVHRDIKPENVFLHRTSRGEVVKVLDFGIAKLLGAPALGDNQTAAGWFFGTPAYMAPERLSRITYDGRADVYSLGVMAFELLAGERPFRSTDGDPASVMSQHTDRPPPLLRSVAPDLSAELEKVIAWALNKDPAERPGAAAFARAFAESVGGQDG